VQADLIMLHVVALSISLLGGGLVWRHRALWSKQQHDPILEPADREFFQGQYRRRTRASTILLVLGLMLNLSNEFLIPWQIFPVLCFIIYVNAMLILVFWMVFLALGDMFAARILHKAALARLQDQQRQLEHTIGQMRNFKDQ
jgi:hypothetical protein